MLASSWIRAASFVLFSLCALSPAPPVAAQVSCEEGCAPGEACGFDGRCGPDANAEHETIFVEPEGEASAREAPRADSETTFFADERSATGLDAPTSASPHRRVASAAGRPGPQLRLESRPRTGLLVAGAVVLAVGYAGAIVTGLFGSLSFGLSSSSGDETGYFVSGLVPVVGSWVQLGFAGGDGGWMLLSGVTGLVQLGGLTMLILGAALRREIPVYGVLRRGRQLVVLPWASHQAGGATATLSF